MTVVVEGLESTESPRSLDYAVRLDFEDGDPLSDAEVSVTVDPAESVSIRDVDETVPGVYIFRLGFPADGSWRVGIGFDHPDGSGSVEFTQVVGGGTEGVPRVMVDTASPERVGSVVTESIITTDTKATASSGSSLPVVVEAFIADQVAPLHIEYAVAIDRVDISSSASIVLSAESDEGDGVEPVALVLDGDVFRTVVDYPSGGKWTVKLVIGHDAETETVEFGENLPWPHFTTEAGTPKVKVDSRDPSREGRLVTGNESVYLRASGSEDNEDVTDTAPSATTTTSTVSTTHAHTDDVVVDVTTPRTEVTLDIALRLTHLVAIGLWLAPIGASLFVTVGPRWVTVSLAGAGLVLGTGLSLVLWGAPVTFPGILRWQEISTRFFGTPYLISFVIKMAAVAIGMLGTLAWARRRTRRPGILILGSSAVALVAVTAMSQFHTFTHL